MVTAREDTRVVLNALHNLIVLNTVKLSDNYLASFIKH